MAESRYKTATALGRPAPTHVNSKAIEDVARLTAYGTYDDIYHNVDEAFSALLREEDDPLSRRALAEGRAIVEGTLRYLGRGLAWTAKSAEGELLDEGARLEVLGPIDALFKREEFARKFASVKRWGLVRGDSLLHVTADPLKPEGTRIRITELDPSTYFPKTDPVDEERVVGCYIVHLVYADDGTTLVAMRLSYDRVMDEEQAANTGLPIGSVRAGMGFFEAAGWDDRYPLTEADLKPAPVPARFNTPSNEALLAGIGLPAAITAIPVYHFPNSPEGNNIFGTSELQGIETLLAGLIQTASDEDMSVALQGIGFYATDSGHPRDAAGNEVEWVVSPASVAELEKGGKMWRVEGATDVKSLQDHMNTLSHGARQASATPDVAMGMVDVQVAESGVALAIQMAPITAKNAEKEDVLLGKLTQFMYDLVNGWMPAYEGYNADGAIVTPSFEDPLPVNRKEEVEEIVTLAKEGIISKDYARTLLQQRLGFQIPADMGDEIANEQAAMLDATGARLDQAADPTAGTAAE